MREKEKEKKLVSQSAYINFLSGRKSSCKLFLSTIPGSIDAAKAVNNGDTFTRLLNCWHGRWSPCFYCSLLSF